MCCGLKNFTNPTYGTDGGALLLKISTEPCLNKHAQTSLLFITSQVTITCRSLCAHARHITRLKPLDFAFPRFQLSNSREWEILQSTFSAA